MKTVFADAGFWIARRDPKDVNHRAALKLTEYAVSQRSIFLLTPLVFAEAHAYFSRATVSRERIIRDCWNNPIVKFEQPSNLDQDQAIEILLKHKDRTFSFCDAVSFAVMQRLQIRVAISFDDHFRQFGQFQVLDGHTL